jgi:hypothetical protein
MHYILYIVLHVRRISTPVWFRILPTFLSSLFAISRRTRRIISCGIAGSHFDQTMFCSLFTADIPVIEASKLLSPVQDPPFNHNQRRRKCLAADRTQTLAIFPRAPAFAERRIRNKRRCYRVPGEFVIKLRWVADKDPYSGFANGSYPT